MTKIEENTQGIEKSMTEIKDNTPKIKENTPKIETERLILRQFCVDDINAVYHLLKDEEVNTYLPWFAVKSIDEAKEFLQTRFINGYKNETGYRYAICLKENNVPIGYVCLSDSLSFDFGYCIAKEFWGKGYVTEGAKAVVERIKNAGYYFITATHDIKNYKSGNVMKKLGMKYKYSYEEQVQPKNMQVIFRMYQLNFDNSNFTYSEYWDKYLNHFIEELN